MVRRLCVLLLIAVLASQATAVEEPVDKFGGWMSVKGEPGETFHLQKLGKRWWLITPEGHGIFIRAVSKVDTSDYGGSGGFMSYDGVFVEMSGSLSPNLALAAESTHVADVVHPAARATLKGAGDALYLGSSRFRPNYTYFWLNVLGKGGRIEWHYSTKDGWKPINGTGRPFKAQALSADGGYHLDVGNYMAPDENGFGKWDNPQADRITWWDMAAGFPSDFTAVKLPGDTVARWYIKGVVRKPFDTPPVLNQVYERADLVEVIARKYGPGDFLAKWAKAATERLRCWGFNAAGQYSYQYVAKSPGLPDRLPVELTWALGDWVTRPDRPYRAKNVCAGAVFPPGSKTLVYQGLQPDVFDPAFERGYMELVRKQGAAAGPWCWALIPEEADYLFGLNSLTHDHMGYVILSQNPYHPKAVRNGKEIVYDDPKLYAKYALRDFLRQRYQGDIAKLNAVWGTSYSTWDTSSGDLLKGTNAWGTGTGFMDENGKGVLSPGARSVGFDKTFTNAAVRKDLDDFVAYFADHYGSILAKAFAQVPHPILLMPLYNGPAFVYKAIAPYVDGFWVSVPQAADALRIYNAGRKPLVVADYLSACPDSPCYFRAEIGSVRYDDARGSTFIVCPKLRYVFRLAQTVAFPDCPALLENYQRLGKPYPYPRVKSAHWDTVELAGDYTPFLKPGMHVEMYKYGKYPYPRRTQQQRAADMRKLYESLLTLRGDDGMAFVIGVEHWCLYDPAPTNWTDNENFGLATFQDNAYDGVEARRATGVDSRGCPIGGEDADYGDLLGPLGTFLRSLSPRSLQFGEF